MAKNVKKNMDDEVLDLTKEIDLLDKKKNNKKEEDIKKVKMVDEEEKEVKKKEKKKVGIGTKVYNVIKLILVIVSIVISILFGRAVLATKMIPNKYIILIVVVLLILNLLIGLLELTKKKWVNIIGFLLLVLTAPLFVVGMGYVNRTMSVIENIITQNEERTTYYVISKKGKFTDISELSLKKVGLLNQEIDLLKAEMEQKVELEYVTYDNVGDLVYALELNEVDAIIVSTSIYQFIIEENGSFEELVEKLTEVEVVGKPDVITSDINIGDSFIIYISGLDTRDTSYLAPYGCSDVNIVVAVNPNTHKVLLVHIPRDYYVYLYNRPHMKDKLTHAGWYGIETSMKSVGNIFNIDINTYLKVNFAALTTLVDRIDGIDVYSDKTFNSSHIKGWVVQKGMNHFNGAKALAYARERYAYNTGDMHRGQNQDDVIKAIINKVSKNPNYLLKYDQILSDMAPYFSTNFEMEDIQGLIKDQVDSGASWNVESYNLTGSDSYNYAATYPQVKAYVMEPNQSTIDTAKAKIFNIMSGK